MRLAPSSAKWSRYSLSNPRECKAESNSKVLLACLALTAASTASLEASIAACLAAATASLKATSSSGIEFLVTLAALTSSGSIAFSDSTKEASRIRLNLTLSIFSWLLSLGLGIVVMRSFRTLWIAFSKSSLFLSS